MDMIIWGLEERYDSSSIISTCQLVYRGPVFCSLILTALTSPSGGRRRLFQATAIYSRLPFSCRLPFRSITDYLTHGNTLIYLYLDLQSESNHLSLHLVFDPSCATDTTPSHPSPDLLTLQFDAFKNEVVTMSR
jgi:hypothetical protein